MRTFLHYGICTKCEKYRLIINKRFKLCQPCNHRRLNLRKTQKEALQDPKYIRLYRKSTRAEIERQAKADRAFYDRLWEENRYHLCRYCGERLYGDWKPYNMDHVLPKAQFPSLRHRKHNVAFTCLSCHGIKTSERYTDRMKEVIIDTANFFIKDKSVIQIGEPNVNCLKSWIIDKTRKPDG